jgi:hypothetical protein
MALSKVNPNFVEQTPYGRRNLIINGAMQVAQRGTQAVGGSTGLHYGGCDRLRVYQETTASAYTLSQDTNVPTAQGFAKSFKLDVTTADASVAAGDRVDLIYRFEGQELQHIKKGTSSAESLTLSFWVSSPKTGTHIVEVYDADNNRQVSIAYTVSTANTWEHKTVAIPADTTGTLNNDANLSLQISWWLMAGSSYTSGTLSTSWSSQNANDRAVGQVNVMDSTSNNFYLTGIQLEVGDTATPFEHRSFAEEQTLCQRYYHQANFLAGPHYGGGALAMYCLNANEAGGTTTFPVTMRAAPTVRTKDAAGNIGGIHRAAIGNVTSGVAIGWGGNADANAKGISGVIKNGAWATGNMLIGGYEADAEL